MERIKDVQKTYTVKQHSFYCDRCGKLIGTKDEDGVDWYNELYKDSGHTETVNFLFNKRFELNGEFCPECLEEIDKRVTFALTSNGYKFTKIEPKDPNNAACSANSSELYELQRY